jgi:nucleolar protein 12
MPTSKFPTSDNEESSPQKTKGETESTQAKTSRLHDRERASNWRDHKDDSGKSDEKKFLTDKEKKKIAFINQDFHSGADTLNAYIVFAHPQPIESRPSNIPPPPSFMDPYEAAQVASQNCDGTEFMARVIRVDVVRKDQTAEKLGHLIDADPKLNVFVGNLDFASQEDDLRVFFESAINAVRGPPGGRDDNDESPKSWVTRVRIIRDRETQLGKGFAYVQFSVSRTSCQKAILLFYTRIANAWTRPLPWKMTNADLQNAPYESSVAKMSLVHPQAPNSPNHERLPPPTPG